MLFIKSSSFTLTVRINRHCTSIYIRMSGIWISGVRQRHWTNIMNTWKLWGVSHNALIPVFLVYSFCFSYPSVRYYTLLSTHCNELSKPNEKQNFRPILNHNFSNLIKSTICVLQYFWNYDTICFKRKKTRPTISQFYLGFCYHIMTPCLQTFHLRVVFFCQVQQIYFVSPWLLKV